MTDQLKVKRVRNRVNSDRLVREVIGTESEASEAIEVQVSEFETAFFCLPQHNQPIFFLVCAVRLRTAYTLTTYNTMSRGGLPGIYMFTI